MTANTPQSRKAKGRAFQQEIRDDLITHLDIPPGDVQSTGMGQSGCDLYLSPAARQRFNASVRDRGMDERKTGGQRVWQGMRVKTQVEEEQGAGEVQGVL